VLAAAENAGAGPRFVCVESLNCMPETKTVRGAFTLAEILSQPQCWTDCLQYVKGTGQLSAACEHVSNQSELLFVGCGSSYYLASVAAASWTAITGRHARAVPASELLLYPDLVLPKAKDVAPVVISRSGKTTEAVKAAEYLEKARNLHTLAVTCAENDLLRREASAALVLAPADEASTVMTRSFSSILLALQLLATSVADQPTLADALHGLARLAGPCLTALRPRMEDFVQKHHFTDYVFLGQGPFYGLAREAMLKVTEMSASYTQVFNTLEFRHGPKAIVGADVLVTFLISETGYEAEVDVLEEIKGLAATTLVVTNAADSRVRAAADLLVELKLDVPEPVRLAAFTFAGQLLGYYTGMKKGLNPDHPPHLSRVVVLEEGTSEETSQHATI